MWVGSMWVEWVVSEDKGDRGSVLTCSVRFRLRAK